MSELDDLKRAFDLPGYIAQNHAGARVIPHGDGFRCRAVWRGGREPDSVAMYRAASGAWLYKDHPRDEAGSAVDFLMSSEGLTERAAIDLMREWAGEPRDIPASPAPKPKPATAEPYPVAQGLPPLERLARKFEGMARAIAPASLWPFLAADGASVLILEARYEWRDAEGNKVKQARPWTWDGTAWQCNAGGLDPRPLFGLDDLASKPGAPVLITEGPRKAAAAREAFPSFACVSAMFGAGGLKRTDLAPLAGREVVLWPDADEVSPRAFREAAALIVAAGARAVRLVNVEGLPRKWDLADLLPEGMGAADLAARLDGAALVGGESQATGTPNRFRVLTPADLANLPPMAWQIEGVLPAGAFAVLYGESGGGKSFVTLDMALSISQGTGWAGLNAEPGSVVYVAGEGLAGLKQRVQAWQITRNVGEGIESLGRLVFIPDAPNLLDPADAAEVSEAIRGASDHLPPPVSLIVFDTLARSMVGGDENSAQDMGRFVAAVDAIRREHNGATAIVVHHTGKGGTGTERGSSALRGAADTMILAEPFGEGEKRGVALTCSKQKDAAPFEPMRFKLREVPEALSCAPVLTETDDENQGRAPEDRLSDRQREVLHALREFCAQNGEVGSSKLADFMNARRDDGNHIHKGTVSKILAQLGNLGYALHDEVLGVYHLGGCRRLPQVAEALQPRQVARLPRLPHPIGWQPATAPATTTATPPDDDDEIEVAI